MVEERLFGAKILRRPFFERKWARFCEQEERVADLFWEVCDVTKITRPSKKQKTGGINFFVTIETSDDEEKIPVVIRLSAKSAQDYKRKFRHSIERKNIQVIVANEDIQDDVLAMRLRSICQTFTIALALRAEVAEVVNAPV